VTVTARDRKILLFVLGAGIVLAYWFLLLSPKRAEQSKQQNALTAAQSARQTAAQRLAQLTAAKRSFAGDYQTVIRLGQSIPASLDMPSLLFQLNIAASGTGIDFSSVQAGSRSSAPGSSSTSSAPSASGASTPASSGAKPAAASSGIPGLDSVPLTFVFTGDYFHLADFFHAMKRFVQVANNEIAVHGRLITIDGFTFKTPQGQSTSPDSLTATVQATVYLAPKAQGLAAGATPQGPQAPTSNAASTQTAGSAPATPAAAVTR